MNVLVRLVSKFNSHLLILSDFLLKTQNILLDNTLVNCFALTQTKNACIIIIKIMKYQI